MVVKEDSWPFKRAGARLPQEVNGFCILQLQGAYLPALCTLRCWDHYGILDWGPIQVPKAFEAKAVRSSHQRLHSPLGQFSATHHYCYRCFPEGEGDAPSRLFSRSSFDCFPQQGRGWQAPPMAPTPSKLTGNGSAVPYLKNSSAEKCQGFDGGYVEKE